jgi:DnaJ-class molecular chaperone
MLQYLSCRWTETSQGKGIMMTTTKIACDKCNGAGRIHSMAHVDGGVCYQCHGTGRIAPRARCAGNGTRTEYTTIKVLGFDMTAVKVGDTVKVDGATGCAWVSENGDVVFSDGVSRSKRTDRVKAAVWAACLPLFV